MTAQRTVTAIATITPRLLLVSAAKGGARSGSRSGDSRTETIAGHAYRPTRMLVPYDTDASVVRYGSTFLPIRTGDDGQERANNGQNTCRRKSARLTKTIRRMLEVVIILMEMIKNFVEVVINFVEVVINLVEVVINLSEMVRRVAGRIWGIIEMVVGMATVKDRTLDTASSDSSIDGVVVVATADYTLLIYISGRVSSAGRSINTMARRSSMLGRRGCVMGWRINIILGRVSSVGRSINTMAKRSSMLGGRGRVMGRRINIMLGSVSMEGGTGSMEGGRDSMEGANAQTAVGRVSSAVGSVRTKAIKKGSTEVLPLDVLLI